MGLNNPLHVICARIRNRYPEAYRPGESIYANPRGLGIRSGSICLGGQYDLVAPDDVEDDLVSITIPSFESDFSIKDPGDLPEIDIKIEKVEFSEEYENARKGWGVQ